VAVLELVGKVGYSVEPVTDFPVYFSGGMRLTLRDSRTLEHREVINRGHPDKPMQVADVQAKFRDHASRALTTERIEAVIETVNRLDELSSVAELATLCVPA
jgi:2-methylcitrate dehydratase PrpD